MLGEFQIRQVLEVSKGIFPVGRAVGYLKSLGGFAEGIFVFIDRTGFQI